MGKVVVNKEKHSFEPIQLNIKIQIDTLAEYLQFKEDTDLILKEWEFTSSIVEELIMNLSEV